MRFTDAKKAYFGCHSPHDGAHPDASLLGEDAGTGVVESTETVTGSFSCSFVDNDYDTNLTGVSGIGTKTPGGWIFPS